MKAKVRRMGCMAWSVLVFMILASSPAVGAEFTAEIVITGPGEGYTYSLHVKDPMYRIQKIQGPMNVPPFPSIVNRDTGMTWGLMPSMRQYVEMPDLEKTFLANPLVGWAMTRKGMTETPGVDETLNGYTCETRVYTVAGESKPAAKVWVAKKLGQVVREERFGGNENPVLELRNIQEGPVDAGLFEIPEGFTRVSMEGGQEKASPSASRGPAPGGSSSPPSKPAGASTAHIVFILDASGSMWGQVDGKPKIAIAKEVLTDLVQDLPDEAVVGLVAYGHRRKGDCRDVEELIPLGKLDKGRVIKTVQGLSPKGKTPITLSVRKTVDRIRHVEEETTIILVSDGKETCDPDPCGLVKELKAAGIKFVMHVIGFDVTEEEREQLECMALEGGGKYYTAGNAGEFLAAAREVVEAPTFTGGYLKITSLKEGKPFEARADVYRQSDSKGMGGKNTWYHKKPAEFKLVPGTYRVSVLDRSVTPHQRQEIRDIDIVSGQTVEKTVTFGGAGILRITAKKGGQPFEARADVYRQSDNKRMGDKNTWYRKKPAEFKLVPGIYRVSVLDPSVTPHQRQEVRDIEVVSGQTVEKTLSFVVGGTLFIKALKDGQPFEARADVYRQSDNKRMGDKNTWYRKKPAEFKLVPGIYRVSVLDRSVTPHQRQELRNIEVLSGQTVEKALSFVVGGTLFIKALKDGQPFEARADVYRQNDNKGMGGKNTWYHKKPAEFKLVPGIYYAKVYDRKTKETKEIRDIEVVSGQTMEKTVAF